MIVDAHAHLFHPAWYPATFVNRLVGEVGRHATASTGAPRVYLRAISDSTGEATLRAMDRAGIDRRIILIVDWGVELGEAESSIETVHGAVLGICRRFSDRLVGFAGLDPRRPRALELLQWAVDGLGARGLKLHPTSAGWTLEDDRTLGLVEFAATRGLIVLVHVGPTFPPLVDQNATVSALLGLVRRYPEATFVAGHAGFARWREFGAGAPLPGNLLLDISGWQSLDGGADTLSHELAGLLEAFPGQVIFGTDSPFVGLSAAGAEARWVLRVRQVLDAGATDAASVFENPRIDVWRRRNAFEP